MIVEQISKIKNYRIFHNFTWGKDLNNFTQYNVIYGRNGSGKSTLSNLFRAIEKRIPIHDATVEFVINGKKISSVELAASPGSPSVRVFNKDFIAETIFTSHGSVAPVFFLGEESIEKQKQIEVLKQLLLKNSFSEKEKCDEKARLEKDFEEFKSSRAKMIKNFLSSSGVNPYNNYDKRAFQSKCMKLLSLTESACSQYFLSEEERLVLSKEKEATLKPKLHEVNLPDPNVKGILEEVNLILQQSLVSNSLEVLKNDPRLSEWVRTGHLEHTMRKSSDCLFCGQTLPTERLQAIEMHFNNAFNALISKIKALSAAIHAQINLLQGFSPPNKLELYDHLIPEYGPQVTALKDDLTASISFLKRLDQCLMEKAKNPFEPMVELIFQPSGRANLLSDLNWIIRKHNEKSDGFQQSIDEARNRLEQSFVAESLSEFKLKSDCIDQLNVMIAEMHAENTSLTKQICELENAIGSHRKPAEELNADIFAYFGRPELTFETRENGYQIYRNGLLAHNLSEGEKSAIALLYFLKTLNDRSFPLKDGIVVIDDPTTGLDNAGVARAFECIKERTKFSGQLFLLTHNDSFFRQVKEWLDALNNSHGKPRAHYYMLGDQMDTVSRSSALIMHDELCPMG